MSFYRNLPRLHHFMMRPVFLLVLSLGVVASANSKTLIFQSQSEVSPEQVGPSFIAGSNAPTQAPKVLNTKRQVASANSELFFMLEQLQQEVRFLRGMLEEQENQIHHLKINGKNRYRDIDSRVLDLSKKLSGVVQPLPVSAPRSDLGSNSVLPKAKVIDKVDSLAAVPKVLTPERSLPSDEQKREYQRAYGLIKEKNFDEAIKQLHLFIEHYPEGELAGNAYYWLGEVYLVLPQLDQAKQAFSVVVSGFPAHRKVADALFKLGVSYDRLQDPAKSEHYLNEVQLKFPESTAAKLARSYKINR